MLLKLLGVLDVVAGVSAVLVGFDVVGVRVGLAVLLYFTLKLFAFGIQLFSLLDVLAGLIVLLGVFLNVGLVFWIAACYVLGKGMWSLA